MVASLVSDIDRPSKKMCEQQQMQQQQEQQQEECCSAAKGGTGSLPLSPDLESLLTAEQKLQLEESRWKLHRLLQPAAHQCANLLVQRIDTPLAAVWPLIRRFDTPQAYKRFVKACVMKGDGNVGSLRDITLVSGLPASCSRERLEILDDEQHVVSFRVIGGEHRLQNYASITSLHEFQVCSGDQQGKVVTVVMESYVVDVPEGNTKEDTCLFTDTVVRCNLRSLARICQANSRQQQQQMLMKKLQQVDGLILMR